MLNKICELEDQVESLNDSVKKLQLKVKICFLIFLFFGKVTILENQKEIISVKQLFFKNKF